MATELETSRSAIFALIALAMGGFAIGTTEFATMSILPLIASGLDITEPVAGHVISVYALGVVIGAPVFAVMSARMRRRKLLIWLMIMFSAANLLSAIAANYELMIAARFLSGLPHGVYFGIASLVAAPLLGPERRAFAVGCPILGLAVATVLGAPMTNLVGQLVGWRLTFVLVAALALLTVFLTLAFVPDETPSTNASPLQELGALRRPQVWFALCIGAIGFGGVFAVYSYLSSTLIAVTGMSAKATPLVFIVFGLGMVSGNIIVPRFASRYLMSATAAMLILSASALALFPLCAQSLATVIPDIFLIGFSASLAPLLQTRLMDVAGDAQALAAALNHSAFNTANALGPFLGGLAIAQGMGWTATGVVGCGLSLGGLAIWAVARHHDRFDRQMSAG